MRSETIQIRQRGTLTLPTKLRAKYRLDDGDILTVVVFVFAILAVHQGKKMVDDQVDR